MTHATNQLTEHDTPTIRKQNRIHATNQTTEHDTHNQSDNRT